MEINELEMLQLLAYFVDEREKVRIARHELKMPRETWTEDAVLQKYKFCNIHREDDPGTIYIAKTIRPMYEHPHFLAISMLARMINSPVVFPTLLEAGAITAKEILPEVIYEWGMKRKGQKLPLYKPAYFSGKPIVKGYTFPMHFRDMAYQGIKTQSLFEGAIRTGDNQKVLDSLMTIRGIGNFLGNQVVMDVAHTPLMEHMDYKEEHTAPGPGSKRGLRRIFGIAKKPMQQLQDVRDFLQMHADAGEDISLHDTQNCLCEFDKYNRRLEGVDSFGARFTPRT